VSAAATGSVVTDTIVDTTRGVIGMPNTAGALIDDGTLNAGQSYAVRAQVIDASGSSGWSDPVTFTAQAPTNPDGVQSGGTGAISPYYTDPGSSCKLSDYMHTGLCISSKVEHHRVTTPFGWHRQGHYNDNCSKSPDHPLGMNFVPACQSHDYGYALGKANVIAQSGANKNWIDRDLYRNLAQGTCPHYILRFVACQDLAARYYAVVKVGGHF
jgi:hypothetical protein